VVFCGGGVVGGVGWASWGGCLGGRGVVVCAVGGVRGVCGVGGWWARVWGRAGLLVGWCLFLGW